MFSLKATLVASTAARPWRTGWATARGVDFTFAPTPATPAEAGGIPAAERACFIDEDWAAPPGAALARRQTRLAAVEAESEADPDASGLRSWWSAASKSS